MAAEKIWFSVTNVRRLTESVEVLLEGGVADPEANEVPWIDVRDTAYPSRPAAKGQTNAEAVAKWIEELYGRISKALEKNRKILGKLDATSGLKVTEVLIQYS